MASNVLLIGNTGAGKSYLLNSIGGTFKSGFSAVDGLTTETSYTTIDICGAAVQLIDTPGLLEASDERMKSNGKAITEALRTPGRLKLIFVLKEQGGRVSTLDLYTIGKVMKAIDYSVDAGVIINMVPEDYMDDFKDKDSQDKIFEQLNDVANNKIQTSWYTVIPRFKRYDSTGAKPYMIDLLTDMTAQALPKVEPIVASTAEYRRFIEAAVGATAWTIALLFFFLIL